jgi:eukaryotic-like serine/threonine-protein kinase
MSSVRTQPLLDPRWQKIEEAVCGAAELPFADRAKWLDDFCGDDQDLRTEIDSLLNAAPLVDQFLEHSVAAYAGSLMKEEVATSTPAKIGQYRILREIGRGGMGIVYLAEREDQFKQHVAIKLVKRGLDTEEILQRFRNERQILASLNHPNIAKLFDGGMTEDGLPYFVMEYIAGESLTKYADQKNLLINERLQLFGRACAAVQHAHQNLIVHRDLKPSNILVTADGEVKLLDFGVAKLLTADSDGDATMTQPARRVMTPQYASPEQIIGQRITTATDVYSLGVVLYELLAGVRPYKVKSTSPQELSSAICEIQPKKPSEALRDTVTGGRGDPENERLAASPRPRVAASGLRGDLDNIVLMSLRKEPERRYRSAEQLAEDLERHLKGLPVIASKDTFAYRADKFIRRNRVAVSAAAIIVVTIVTGMVVALWQGHNARQQRDLAQHERLKAERINTFLQRMLSFSNQSITSVSPVAERRNVTVNEMLDQITPQVEAELADQPDVRAQIQRTIGSAYASQGRYDLAERNLHAALNAQNQVYGNDSLEAADTMSELGILYMRQARYEEASNLLEKAVATYRKQRQANVPGFSDAKFALALDYLGSTKFYQISPVAAKPLLIEALQISSTANLQGPERWVVAFNKSDLGGAMIYTGEIEKGEGLLREALAEYDKISTQPRWERGATLVLLSAVAFYKKQLDAAEKLLWEAERIYRQTLGDSNPYVSFVLNMQASLLLQKGNLKGAEQKARESLVMVQATKPNNESSWSEPMTTLADVLTKAGQLRDGENYYRQAVAILERQPQKDHSSIAQLKIRLSESLMKQNRLAESEQIAVEAREDVLHNLGEQHPLMKSAIANLRAIYEKEGKRDLVQALEPHP